MVDYPYPASFLAPLPAYPVNVSCHFLLEEEDKLRGLAKAAGISLHYALTWLHVGIQTRPLLLCQRNKGRQKKLNDIPSVLLPLYVQYKLSCLYCLALLGLFYNGTTGVLTCHNITKEYVECADPTGCGTGPASLSTDFQVRCSLMPRPPHTFFFTSVQKKHREDLLWSISCMRVPLSICHAPECQNYTVDYSCTFNPYARPALRWESLSAPTM